MKERLIKMRVIFGSVTNFNQVVNLNKIKFQIAEGFQV